MQKTRSGRFKPSKRIVESLVAVLRHDEEWHLLDEQRLAFNAIWAEVERLRHKRNRSAVAVRGGPGTGKSVIAVQLLAEALLLAAAGGALGVAAGFGAIRALLAIDTAGLPRLGDAGAWLAVACCATLAAMLIVESFSTAALGWSRYWEHDEAPTRVLAAAR